SISEVGVCKVLPGKNSRLARGQAVLRGGYSFCHTISAVATTAPASSRINIFPRIITPSSCPSKSHFRSVRMVILFPSLLHVADHPILFHHSFEPYQHARSPLGRKS